MSKHTSTACFASIFLPPCTPHFLFASNRLSPYLYPAQMWFRLRIERPNTPDACFCVPKSLFLISLLLFGGSPLTLLRYLVLTYLQNIYIERIAPQNLAIKAAMPSVSRSPVNNKETFRKKKFYDNALIVCIIKCSF